MRTKHFKNADVDVSSFAVGTWQIGGAGYGKIVDEDSVAAIRAALDGGVNLIDTAPAYGRGHAEKIVGEAIKPYARDRFMISTKFGVGRSHVKVKYMLHKGLPIPDHGVRDSSFASVLYECEQSLRRLGTDYIDFYHVHWPDYDTPFEETMDALNLLKKEGKIRFIGLSNFSREQILECEKYAKIDVIQPPYSMVVRRDEDLMKWCVGRGIDTLSYGSLGAGILSGRYREVPVFGAEDPRANGFYPYFKEPYFSKVMKLLEVIDTVAEETGRPVPQVVTNWTTRKDYVSCALIGVRNAEQAKDNCAAFDFELTDDQMARIDEAVETWIDFDGSAPMK